jgi:hypothetical protein
MHRLTSVIPNEQWQLLLEFSGEEHRLFDSSVARLEMGWAELAYPNKLKNLTFSDHSVSWPGGRTLDSGYLYSKSEPVSAELLASQVLRLGYKNQAPTSAHSSHHVYGVYLYPYRRQPFEVGESIGGGHGETGASRSFSLAELLAWSDWKLNFELSGCAWAISLVEQAFAERELLRSLVKQICFREGVGGA